MTKLFSLRKKIGGKILYGCINNEGEIIIEPKYEYDIDFSDSGLACVELHHSRENRREEFIININGEIIKKLDDELHVVRTFSEGLAPALSRKRNEYCFINEIGEVEFYLGEKWKYFKSFSEGLAIVENRFEFKYINKKGEFEFEETFEDEAHSFSCGRAIVFNPQKAEKGEHYIKKDGNVFDISIGIVESQSSRFSENIAAVHLPFNPREGILKKYIFIGKEGEQLFPVRVKSASYFHEGFCVVEDFKRKYGVINIKGVYVIPSIYDHIGTFGKDGVVPFQRDGRWGLFIDHKECFVDKDIKDIWSFYNNNLARASYNGKPVYINKLGEIVADLYID